MSLLLALDSSVSFELSSQFRSFNFNFSLANFSAGMDRIPFVSVYIRSILLIIAANMQS